MAVFITGDTHGDFTRFKKDIFYEQAELTKEDCVIICGDFGEFGTAAPRKTTGWTGWRTSPLPHSSSVGTMKTLTCSQTIRCPSGTAVRCGKSAPR